MKKLIIIALALLLVTGCTSEKLQEDINKTTGEASYNEKITNEKANAQNLTEEKIETALNIRTTTDASTNADIEVINYITSIENEVNTLSSEKDLTTTTKSKLKSSFIILTDFIFYGGTINGVTFEELSLSAKEKALEIYTAIDQKIETIWPNYKETIKTTSEKIYTNIKEKTIGLKDELESKYMEEIEENAYNNSTQIFNEDVERLKENITPTIDYVTEKSKETYENIKNKASNWYENFKESSE